MPGTVPNTRERMGTRQRGPGNSKTDVVRRWWDTLPPRKQRGRYGISGGERCKKEDKLENETECGCG